MSRYKLRFIKQNPAGLRIVKQSVLADCRNALFLFFGDSPKPFIMNLKTGRVFCSPSANRGRTDFETLSAYILSAPETPG